MEIIIITMMLVMSADPDREAIVLRIILPTLPPACGRTAQECAFRYLLRRETLC